MGVTIVLRVGLAWKGHHVAPSWLLSGRVVISWARLAGGWQWGRMVEARSGFAWD